ncbi:hypothetical protein LCGC14_0897380 [marine sediment metagenome]|uniref:Uncharacterized protein n=1 Tax=marine sediment metagenome TaxID=412755 RepID=A0A0F9PI58_9ZZZZ
MKCRYCGAEIPDTAVEKMIRAILGQAPDLCQECIYLYELPRCPEPGCGRPLVTAVNGMCMQCYITKYPVW